MKALLLFNRCLVLLVWLCLSTAALATDTPSRGIFWEVSSGKSTVYLLGSIHLARPSLYPLSPGIEQAFDRSNVLVVEVSQEAMNSEQFQRQLLAKGFYQGNESLLDSIDDETNELLQAFLSQYRLPSEPFMKMKPGMVAMSLAGIQMRAMGFSGEHGIDRYFEQRAAGRMPIKSLETIEQQLELITDMPRADALLKYSLLDMQQAERDIETMIQAWRQGDSQALEALVLTPFVDEPEFQPILDKVFFERNQQMTKRIADMLTSSDIHFVVVGAGHLLGEQGIVELLRQQQFSVRQP